MNDCTDKAACIGRREFLVKAGLFAGGAVLTVSAVPGTALGRAFDDVTVAIDPDSPLAKIGGSKVIDTPAGKVIVIQAEKGKFVAFSAKCTHKGSILDYNPDSKQLECPKHGSRFDGVTGELKKGPAETGLKTFPAKGGDSGVVVTV